MHAMVGRSNTKLLSAAPLLVTLLINLFSVGTGCLNPALPICEKQEPWALTDRAPPANASRANPEEESDWGYENWIQASLVSVSICSFISYVCSYSMSSLGFMNKRQMSNLLFFGAGAMLADFFLHMVPHTMSHVRVDLHSHHHGNNAHDHDPTDDHSATESVSLETLFMFVLLGIVSTQVIDMLICAIREYVIEETRGRDDVPHTRMAQAENCDDSTSLKALKCTLLSYCLPALEIHPVAFMSLAFDVVHNFLDAVTICSAFRVSRRLGIMASLATFAHELAQELSDFALLLHSGLSAQRALTLNVATSFSAFLGVFVTVHIGLDEWGASGSAPLLFFSGGALLRIAMVEMMAGAVQEHPPKKLADVLMGGFCLVAGIGSLHFVSGIETLAGI